MDWIENVSIQSSTKKNSPFNSSHRFKKYQVYSPKESISNSFLYDDSQSTLTAGRSIHTVRINLLTDHRSHQRTSSALRRKQLASEFSALKHSVESSYKAYRNKKKPDVQGARYSQWASWFKKRYSTDPTTKLTKREFEKLWSWFGKLSNSKSDGEQKTSTSQGIQLDIIVDAFIEYGVFENRQNALKLLKTIDTDRNQTITFVEFMDGINSGNVTQTLQLKYFVSSLVDHRKRKPLSDGKNVLGVFSNAVLNSRLKRRSSNSRLGATSEDLGSADESDDSFAHKRNVDESPSAPSTEPKLGSELEQPIAKPAPKPASYTSSRTHPLAARWQALSTKMASPNRVYADMNS